MISFSFGNHPLPVRRSGKHFLSTPSPMKAAVEALVDGLWRSVVADREVLKRTLGLRAPITISRRRDVAHAVELLAVRGVRLDANRNILHRRGRAVVQRRPPRRRRTRERHARSAPGEIIVPRASGIKLFPRLRQNSRVQSAAVQHSPHPAGVNRSAPKVISAAGPAQADSRGSLGRRTIATRPEQLLHGQERPRRPMQ
jgi:hypothetical protein